MTVELLQTLSLISYILAGVLFLASVVLFFRLKVPTLWGEVSGRTARKAIRAMKWNHENENNSPVPLPNAQTNSKLTAKIARANSAEDQEKEEVESHSAAPLVAAVQKPPLKQAPVHEEEAPLQQETPLAPVLNETALTSNNTLGETSSLPSQSIEETSILPREAPGETALLSTALGETSVLSANAQTLPSSDEDTLGQTSVLTAAVYGETSVLNVSPFKEEDSGHTGELPAYDETTLLTQQAFQSAHRREESSIFELEEELAFTDSTEIIE